MRIDTDTTSRMMSEHDILSWKGLTAVGQAYGSNSNSEMSKWPVMLLIIFFNNPLAHLLSVKGNHKNQAEANLTLNEIHT